MKSCRVYLPIAITLFVFLNPVPSLQGQSRGSIVRYDRDSRYYRIIVADYPEIDRRILFFSKTRGAQSSMILSDPDRLGLAYLRTMVSALPLHGNPRDVLVIGLGGAAIPKFLKKHYPDVRIDIVEIDPDVIQVARKYFEFQPSDTMRLIAMDGRMYLSQVTKKYDVILLDAYSSDTIPFHLTTEEFYRLVKDRLNPGGVAAANLWEYFINKFYKAELKTVQTVFPQTYLLETPDPASKVLFATLDGARVSAAEWKRRAEAFVGSRDLQYDLPGLVEREYSVITGQDIRAKVLTDNMAPVDILRSQRAGQ